MAAFAHNAPHTELVGDPMAAADTSKKDVRWGPCCFCGQEIAATDVDPCSVTVETSKKKWQTWFCHAACFRSNLAKADIDLSPAHF